MDRQFWHDRWRENRIGFHEGRANELMTRHIATVCPTPGARIFVPLCGKSRDIGWLLSRGYHVVGVELSGTAIDQLFDELGVTPEIIDLGAFKSYRAEGIEIFVGDIFDLDAARLGPVDASYDRAALVALPNGMRQRYAIHLAEITCNAPILQINFEYDQTLMDGPPFSIPAEMLQALHGARYTIAQLEARPVEGNLKGIVLATEAAWHLTAL